MNFVRRIALFLAVNLLVVVTLSFILNLLGVHSYITAAGIDYNALMIFCLVWGMGGALISLAMSRMMAKWAMGVQVINPSMERDPGLLALVQKVHMLARSAGLSTMPEVGIYNSPEVNAFATGPTRDHSLVAVSTGLLQRMNTNEVDGVLGHEIAHIANGDMVTMTLLQGVVNAFAMFLARVIAFAVAQVGSSRDDREESSGFSSGIYFVTQFVLEIVFMILGSLVVAWFSRLREYRADEGGARLAGKQNMVAALESLARMRELVDETAQPAAATLKISGQGTGIFRFFSTHPPLEDRIARLRQS